VNGPTGRRAGRSHPKIHQRVLMLRWAAPCQFDQQVNAEKLASVRALRRASPPGHRPAWEADTLPAELLPLGRLGPKPVRRESTTGARRWASRRDTSLGRMAAGCQSPVRSGGPRGGGVEQGGLAVAPPGTGNRPGVLDARCAVGTIGSPRTGDFGEQLNSGHAAAPVERVRRVPGSRTHRLFFIPDLAADDSPPAERSCATGRRIW